MDTCGSTIVRGATTSTTPMENYSNVDVIVQWDLLVKQQDFWKNKQYITVSWAFYAPLNSSLTLPKVNSSSNPNSNQLEQMKCVVFFWML